MPANQSTPPNGQEASGESTATPLAMGEVFLEPTEADVTISVVDDLADLSLRSSELNFRVMIEQEDVERLRDELTEALVEIEATAD